MKIDPQVDALYQVPPDQFTAKRNALAKELSGTARKQIKFLTKPPLPIWAVNQLFWKDRGTYEALIDASEKVRTAHRSALSGKKADIRKAEQLHRTTLEKAMAATIGLLQQSQGQVSDAARDTIRKALSALPTDEAPGRLTRAPEAAGFSLLTGIKPRDIKPIAAPAEKTASPTTNPSVRTNAAQERSNRIAAEKAKRAREKALAAAEQDLLRARKAAEQAKFKVRKLSTELQRAQATEERLSNEVSTAEQKISNLRAAD